MLKDFRLLRIFVVAVVLFMMSIVTSAQQNTKLIIVFKDNFVPTGNAVAQLASQHGLQVSYMYRSALNGIAADVPAGRLNALRNDPRVKYVEEDLLMQITAQTVPTGLDRSFTSGNSNMDIDGVDDWRVDVDVAVIDTGVDFQHPDLNVVGGTDCTLTIGGGPFATRYCGAPGEGTGGDDDHYHGTHVAGTIGAIDNGFGVVGMAPGARIWAVKVLDHRGSGYTSGIIAGIDWVIANGTIEVANMSLGGEGISQAYKDAIDNAVANGVVMVVAAGNSDADANNYSPAYVPSAITVSALADFDGQAGGFGSPTCRDDQDDTLADFSNWGSAVDIAAPGVCILSTYPLEQGEYNTISGTSMAAPHVAGAAAVLASNNTALQSCSDATACTDAVTAIRDTLVNNGNLNWTDDSGDGIKERLLDLSNTSLFSPALIAGNGDGGGSNAAPVASFTHSCTDLSCTFDGSGSSDSDGSIASYAWDFGDGNTATSAATGHIFATAGDYNVVLTVTDNEGATDTTGRWITVTSGGGGSSVHVGDLDASTSTLGRNGWKAEFTITVHSDSETPVSGATVNGSIDGTSGSCVTDTNGSCTLSTSNLKNAPSVTFTVDSVSASGASYNAGANHDPDGDSNGTSITITAP